MTQYLESHQSLVPGLLRLYSARTQRIFPQLGAACIDDRDSCFHDKPHALLVLSIVLAYKPKSTQSIFLFTMRQLKGKVKENAKQKRERKKEFVENKKRVLTIALPSIAAIFVFITVYIYLKTRPKPSIDY
uniref:Single-pass membrane and coiled-coil domain-containing protein 4 homolog n=1 Tax=Timema cristinae TaxID=61476 RepID=A0A7R9DB65_TIMCR|nr:unnamed protein product [Timema cristinae]